MSTVRSDTIAGRYADATITITFEDSTDSTNAEWLLSWASAEVRSMTDRYPYDHSGSIDGELRVRNYGKLVQFHVSITPHGRSDNGISLTDAYHQLEHFICDLHEKLAGLNCIDNLARSFMTRGMPADVADEFRAIHRDRLMQPATDDPAAEAMPADDTDIILAFMGGDSIIPGQERSAFDGFRFNVN